MDTQKIILAGGFTLVEMMVTLTIAAVMLSLAAPSFLAFFINNRLTSQANDLVTALNIARSEAVKRGVRVTVCKSADPAAASPSCAAAASWQNGFIVFVDNTQVIGNGKGVVDGTDEVLRVFGSLSNSTLTADVNYGLAISYLASGMSRGIKADGSDGLANGDFTLCNSGRGRYIVISTTGRIRTEVVDAC